MRKINGEKKRAVNRVSLEYVMDGHYGDQTRLGWVWWLGESKVTETPVLTILTVNLQSGLLFGARR